MKQAEKKPDIGYVMKGYMYVRYIHVLTKRILLYYCLILYMIQVLY